MLIERINSFINAVASDIKSLYANKVNKTDVIAVAQGGTGGTDVATARSNLGLGTAATKNVGTTNGNIMEVGAFGVGGFNNITSAISTPSQMPKGLSLAMMTTDLLSIGSSASWQSAAVLSLRPWDTSLLAGSQAQIAICGPSNLFFRAGRNWDDSDIFDGGWVGIYTERNTTKDANGFIKAASPVVKLFADKIELNEEAKLQDIAFEKLGVGDYLIKGSLGFAQEGWYIEMPKDANGNVLVAVVYEQLANNDISVKTYDYMLNKKGRIVPDLETPLDIPATRWIDLRLQELPQTDIKPFSTDETAATTD